MKAKMVFRIISLCMFIFAVVFVIIALTTPNLGSTIYIGSLRLGAREWLIYYAVYIIVMVGLFVISFSN